MVAIAGPQRRAPGGGRWEREERLEHETSKSTKDTKKRAATRIFALLSHICSSRRQF